MSPVGTRLPRQGGSVGSTVALCLVFVGLVLAAFVYTMTRENVLTVDQLREVGSIMLPTPRALAEVQLQSTASGAFTESDLEGPWSFLFFGFTNCPDICPTTLSDMGKAVVAMSPEEQADFRGVLVTVDPERDTLDLLEAYATAFNENFIGLTGSREQIARFASQVNAAFQKLPGRPGEPYQMDHTGNIVIINPRGHYHGFIKLPHSRETILNTFRTLRATF